MLIVCPHCQNPMDLAETTQAREICCTSCGSSFQLEQQATADWTPPQRHKLGKFALRRTLGQGAFGIVYEAHDPELDRVVAIKIPRSGHLADSADLERLLREARSVAQLRHPSIVALYEVGQADSLPYLVCELVQGVTLTDLMSSRRLAVREAVELAAALAEALQFAHDRGVVHRDVKPSNIMVDEKHLPRLMDFGLAKRETGDATLTIEGQVLGTPAYMSPEQARGESHRVDGRSDVYSLGVLLYQMLTQELPFRGTPRMLLHQVLNDEPRSPRSLNEHIPRDLETIIVKAMAKEPARRYASAAELADDLRRHLRGEPIRARPVSGWEKAWHWVRRRPAVAGLIAASIIAALALVAVVVGASYSSRLAEEKQRAEAARDSAELAQRGETEQRKKAENYLYFSRIALAEREWSANNVARTEQLLAECPVGLRGWEWHYLKRMCHTELRTLRAHSQQAACVAFSPDGRWLVSGGYDKTLKIWHASTGKEEKSISLRDGVYCLAFSPQGERLAVGYFTGDDSKPVEIDLWDTANWERQTRCPGQMFVHYGVTFDPSGQKVAAASGDRSLWIWDAKSGKMLHTFRSKEAPFSSVAFSPNKSVVAGAIGDPDDVPVSRVGKVMLWNAVSGDLMRTLSGHENGVLSIAFSPAGTQLASASLDQTIKIWDPTTGKELRTLRGHTSGVICLSYGLNGQLLASGSFDGSVRVWDPSNGRLLRTLRGHAGPVNGVAFNKSGHRLASAGADGTVKIWDPVLDVDCRSLPLGAVVTLCVSLSADGKKLVASGSDGALKIFDAVTDQEQRILSGHKMRVWTCQFSRDGQRVVSASEDQTARVWDVATGKEIACLKGHGKWVQGAVWSPDGLRVATASGDQTVKIWDARTGRELRSLAGHTDRVWSVAYNPDGDRLASCAGDKTVKIWDPSADKEIATLTGHMDEVTYVTFSPDGRRLASSSLDQTVKIWEPASGKPLITLKGHTGMVHNLGFSPDGKRLASAGLDLVKVWDLDAGEELFALRAETAGFYSVAFSPDGQRIVAAAMDGTVRIWDATPAADGNLR